MADFFLMAIKTYWLNWEQFCSPRLKHKTKVESALNIRALKSHGMGNAIKRNKKPFLSSRTTLAKVFSYTVLVG